MFFRSFTKIYNDIILISHCKETDFQFSLQIFIQLFFILAIFYHKLIPVVRKTLFLFRQIPGITQEKSGDENILVTALYHLLVSYSSSSSICSRGGASSAAFSKAASEAAS